MGPSWYMMPDIFEEFFTLLGENIEDYFQLKKLSPSYRIFLQSSGKQYDFFLTEKKSNTLDSIEPGSGDKLAAYLDESARQYDIAKDEFIFETTTLFFFLQPTHNERRS